jgi:hypothetical protein
VCVLKFTWWKVEIKRLVMEEAPEWLHEEQGQGEEETESEDVDVPTSTPLSTQSETPTNGHVSPAT